jgi:AcrR family transcriptional regulator
MATITAKKRPGRPPDEALQERRRAGILAAAAKHFARRGFQGTDVQDIADELKISKGSVYRYFPTKQELFLATVDHGVRQLHEYICQSSEHVHDPLERMAAAVRAYLAFFKSHPELVELFIQERAEFRDRGKTIYFRQRELRVGRWEDVCRDLMASGRLRKMPAGRIVGVMGDLMYGTMFSNHFAGRNKPHSEQAADILDTVFHGILSESERKRLGQCGARNGHHGK